MSRPWPTGGCCGLEKKNLKCLKTENVRNIKNPSLNIFLNYFLNVAGCDYIYRKKLIILIIHLLR
jgi:hypothetical protein